MTHDQPPRRRYLLCPPTHFAVDYSINPWMDPAGPVSADRAVAQWRGVHDALVRAGHEVLLLEPQPTLPDLVFTANGGIVIGDRALVAHFRHPQRAAESVLVAARLAELGLDVHTAEHVNEGEGDFRLAGDIVLGGHGLRSEAAAVREVADFFDLPVVPLTLTDPRYYHLDTALAVLDDDTVAYLPEAFDPASRGILRDLFPDAITASAQDAAVLGVNMVSDGRTVLMSAEAPDLGARIAERGFTVVPLELDELRKAGGGAKCCVLELHQQPAGTADDTVVAGGALTAG
ncbi:MAG: dimethylargininase [Jatrophihabitans sp.]|uniref:dimethylargininase n=1 Tax=Jatrophihabitans sp. TaxID=1932789 RepID=UPI003F7EFE2A